MQFYLLYLRNQRVNNRKQITIGKILQFAYWIGKEMCTCIFRVLYKNYDQKQIFNMIGSELKQLFGK